jgi:hypothetical protein
MNEEGVRHTSHVPCGSSPTLAKPRIRLCAVCASQWDVSILVTQCHCSLFLSVLCPISAEPCFISFPELWMKRVHFLGKWSPNSKQSHKCALTVLSERCWLGGSLFQRGPLPISLLPWCKSAQTRKGCQRKIPTRRQSRSWGHHAMQTPVLVDNYKLSGTSAQQTHFRPAASVFICTWQYSYDGSQSGSSHRDLPAHLHETTYSKHDTPPQDVPHNGVTEGHALTFFIYIFIHTRTHTHIWRVLEFGWRDWGKPQETLTAVKLDTLWMLVTHNHCFCDWWSI